MTDGAARFAFAFAFDVDGTTPVSIYVDGPARVVDASSAAPSGVAVKGHSRMGMSRVFDEISVRSVARGVFVGLVRAFVEYAALLTHGLSRES